MSEYYQYLVIGGKVTPEAVTSLDELADRLSLIDGSIDIAPPGTKIAPPATKYGVIEDGYLVFSGSGSYNPLAVLEVCEKYQIPYRLWTEGDAEGAYLLAWNPSEEDYDMVTASHRNTPTIDIYSLQAVLSGNKTLEVIVRDLFRFTEESMPTVEMP